MRRWPSLALAAALVAAGPALGQEEPDGEVSGPAPVQVQAPDFGTGQLVSPILTIDPDALFDGTAYGQRIREELRAASEDLAAENREIEATLTEEERSLTARRPTMEPDAFRAEAQAFDARVQQIRNEQDAKERALQQILSRGREAFLRDASPVLGRMMLEAESAVILDRRNVFLSVGALDITDEAIALIDEALGDGADETLAPTPDEAPADESPADTPAELPEVTPEEAPEPAPDQAPAEE
ncbi:OmpH family outer membrane protein [Pseudoroseicyclus sp. CXY001]|uniref:OmpH family outer membrane protein n=1 Tax=Pseudoroseicyclus sp. CXY001 TaxID=3242492 RepID=UPI00358DCE07